MLQKILEKKIEANTYLPKLAEAYVLGEVALDDLVLYFENFAHLYTVGIDVNAVCNLSCKYCYLDNYNLNSAPQYADLSHFFEFIRDVSIQGVDLIALVGKEPFADNRGIELLEFLDQLSNQGRDFRFGVVTNGTLVDRYLERLPRSIAYIDISLDGSAHINDAIRGAGVFKRAAANVRRLIDSGFEVWISGVLSTAGGNEEALREFIRILCSEYGCGRFYFSPIRNFTGTLTPFLLSYQEISHVQNCLVEISEAITGVERIILDHPYEAVWRDYFWPLEVGEPSQIKNLVTDGFGNVLEKLTTRCFRKLDIFTHGPWGTCRIDARGEYLADVESRTYAYPTAVGSIKNKRVAELHVLAMQHLRPMLENFLRNMNSVKGKNEGSVALTSVSVPSVV